MTQEPSLLSELLNSDLLALPTLQQRYILSVLIKGIFMTSPAETFEQHLRKQSDALLRLLRAIEETGVPHKATPAIQNALTAIPQVKRTEEIDACITRIFTPSPSFFQRLKTRFLKI